MRRMGGPAFLSITAICLGLGGSIQPALAHDHFPPDARIMAAGGRQRGLDYSVSWSRPSGPGECVTTDGDGDQVFPPGLAVPPGRVKGELLLTKRHRPQRLKLIGWEEVDEQGHAVGRGTVIDYDLGAKRRRGRVVSRVASFAVTVTDELYLAAGASWRDRDGCGGTQSVAWTFHLTAAA